MSTPSSHHHQNECHTSLYTCQRDGNRFESEYTLKFLVETGYEFSIYVRPSLPLHSISVQAGMVSFTDHSPGQEAGRLLQVHVHLVLGARGAEQEEGQDKYSTVDAVCGRDQAAGAAAGQVLPRGRHSARDVGNASEADRPGVPHQAGYSLPRHLESDLQVEATHGHTTVHPPPCSLLLLYLVAASLLFVPLFLRYVVS